MQLKQLKMVPDLAEKHTLRHHWQTFTLLFKTIICNNPADEHQCNISSNCQPFLWSSI